MVLTIPVPTLMAASVLTISSFLLILSLPFNNVEFSHSIPYSHQTIELFTSRLIQPLVLVLVLLPYGLPPLVNYTLARRLFATTMSPTYTPCSPITMSLIVWLNLRNSAKNSHLWNPQSTQCSISTLDDAIALTESIDRDVTRLMLASENKVRRRSPYPFSSTLAQCCLSVAILKIHRCCLSTPRSKDASRESLQSLQKTPLDLPMSLDATKLALKQA